MKVQRRHRPHSMMGNPIVIDNRGFPRVQLWVGEGRPGQKLVLLFSAGLPVEVQRRRRPHSMMGKPILIDNRGFPRVQLWGGG